MILRWRYCAGAADGMRAKPGHRMGSTLGSVVCALRDNGCCWVRSGKAPPLPLGVIICGRTPRPSLLCVPLG